MSDRAKHRKVERVRLSKERLRKLQEQLAMDEQTKPPARDDVGYGRPPLEHRFQPGRSGNPRGRPKGAKSESIILQELLHRKITLREAGRARKVTVLEAMLLKFAEDSLKGNTKSAQFLLNRYGSVNAADVPSDHLNGDEREILEAYARKLLDQHREMEGDDQ